MKTIQIRGRTGISTIRVGESLESLPRYAPVDKTVTITDTHLRHLHGKGFPPCKVVEIASGEKANTLKTVKEICLKLMEIGADRSTFIVGIGGGVVSDIAGFCASVYMRRVPFGFVSTTLLSQVDAGTGGKNGVNLAGYKNMTGVFNQPQFVICDLNLLKTLPRKELLSGFAEIVKHAVIEDPELLSYLESNAERALSLEREVIEDLSGIR